MKEWEWGEVVSQGGGVACLGQGASRAAPAAGTRSPLVAAAAAGSFLPLLQPWPPTLLSLTLCAVLTCRPGACRPTAC